MEICLHILKHISAGGEDRPELKACFVPINCFAMGISAKVQQE
jgi:hypothetical protein